MHVGLKERGIITVIFDTPQKEELDGHLKVRVRLAFFEGREDFTNCDKGNQIFVSSMNDLTYKSAILVRHWVRHLALGYKDSTGKKLKPKFEILYPGWGNVWSFIFSFKK